MKNLSEMINYYLADILYYFKLKNINKNIYV